MNHHRLPAALPHPVQAPAGNEIRFPLCSGRHNARAAKEVSHEQHQT